MSDILLTNDYDEIITKNRHTILDGILGAQTPQQVESSIGFSNYLSHVGIMSSNDNKLSRDLMKVRNIETIEL